MKVILLIICRVFGFRQFNWYYDNRIHNTGNIGLGGKFHANTAAYFTNIIDKLSYNGTDVRYRSLYNSKKVMKGDVENILDMGCGVGISTRALKCVYPGSDIIGLDCSYSMLKNCPNLEVKFEKGFIHKTDYDDDSFDFINSMFIFHEIPSYGRVEVLNEISRVLRPGGYLNILDIRLDYRANKWMLSGEPYLLDYLDNFESEINDSRFKIIDKNCKRSNQLDTLLRMK